MSPRDLCIARPWARGRRSRLIDSAGCRTGREPKHLDRSQGETADDLTRCLRRFSIKWVTADAICVSGRRLSHALTNTLVSDGKCEKSWGRAHLFRVRAHTT